MESEYLHLALLVTTLDPRFALDDLAAARIHCFTASREVKLPEWHDKLMKA